MSRPAWHIRLWGTLSEPRIVTVLMVAIYCGLVSAVALIAFDHRPDDAVTLFGCALAAIGGLVGAPSAWRGSWWLEGVAALMAVLGLVILGVLDLMHAAEAVRWPGFPLILTLMVAGFFGTRALRIWPHTYRPDVAPPDQVAAARAKMQAFRAIDAATLAAAGESPEAS